MGRYAYFSDGQEHKFWFAVQSSLDITEFGGAEANSEMLNWQWSTDDLEFVETELRKLIKEMPKECGMTYRQLFAEYRKLGNLIPVGHKVKGIKDFKKVERLASKIDLGLKIRRGIKKGDSLYVEAEY